MRSIDREITSYYWIDFDFDNEETLTEIPFRFEPSFLRIPLPSTYFPSLFRNWNFIGIHRYTTSYIPVSSQLQLHDVRKIILKLSNFDDSINNTVRRSDGIVLDSVIFDTTVVVKSLEDIDPVYTCDRFARGKKVWISSSRPREIERQSCDPCFRGLAEIQNLSFSSIPRIFTTIRVRTRTNACVRSV